MTRLVTKFTNRGRGWVGWGLFGHAKSSVKKNSLCKKKKKKSNRWLMLSLLPQVFHLYENVNKSENFSKSVLMTEYGKKFELYMKFLSSLV